MDKSWIDITDGKITVKVPYQAFLDLYVHNGFREVGENPTLYSNKKDIKVGENDKSRENKDTKIKVQTTSKISVAKTKSTR